MKILYLVSLFPCWSETFIVRELHALKARGFDLEIYSLKPASEKMVHDDAAALLDKTQYPSSLVLLIFQALYMFVRRPILNLRLLLSILTGMIHYPGALLKSLITFVLALDAAYKLRKSPPDRLHAHWATYPSTAAWVISENLRIPFGFTSHAHDIFLENHLLEKKTAAADLCVTISAFNINYLSKLIGSQARDKFHVVHCGVDITSFSQTADANNRRIVSVGRFDEIKGFRFLVEACGKLRDKNIPFQCEIVGEGPLQAAIEGEIHRLNLQDQVTLKGAMPQAEVRNFIAEGSIFCLPSVITAEGNMDGIPVVLMEAMALGTAVVSTRVSGIPELVIDKQTGILCEPRDSESLAAALETLLADSELRLKLSAAAREKVENEFDCHREAAKLADLFGKVS